MSFQDSPCYGCGCEHGEVSLCCQRMGSPPFQVAVIDPATRSCECVADGEADFATIAGLPTNLADLFWGSVSETINGQSRLAERLPCAGLAESGECLFESHKPGSCAAMAATPGDPESRCARIRSAWPADPAEGGN